MVVVSAVYDCNEHYRLDISLLLGSHWSGNWAVINMGVGAQSTLGGTTFLREKYVWKIIKMPEFYIIIDRKIFSRIISFGGRAPPDRVSYAYGD